MPFTFGDAIVQSSWQIKTPVGGVSLGQKPHPPQAPGTNCPQQNSGVSSARDWPTREGRQHRTSSSPSGGWPPRQVGWRARLFCFSEQTKLKPNLGSSQLYLETEWILIICKILPTWGQQQQEPFWDWWKGSDKGRLSGTRGKISGSGNRGASPHWAFPLSLLEVYHHN